MAKRFTDTQKYHKPFIRGLQGAYKLLWDFIYHECDHAGIWIVDFEIAQILIGKDMPVNKEDALKFFNTNPNDKKIYEVDNGNKWFIPSFIEFQYGELNPENRAHRSVIFILKKYNLFDEKKGLISPLKGCKDKDKDMDKDKDTKRGKCLMRNSGVILQDLEKVFAETNEFKKADPSYYYNIVLDWSNSDNNMKTDWMSTIKNWARKDIKDGKLKEGFQRATNLIK